MDVVEHCFRLLGLQAYWYQHHQQRRKHELIVAQVTLLVRTESRSQ
jgi:hypothetical protein